MSKVTISSTYEYIVGSAVASSDGACGDLRRIIVDPAARTITHLVVEPRHHHGEGHLVPIGLVNSTGSKIQLNCTTSEFQGLENAEATHLVPGPGKLSYTEDEKRSLPIGGMAGGGGMAGLGPAPAMGGMGVGGMGAMGRGPVRQAFLTADQVPAGEIELCEDQPVHATDGAIGRVQGLAVDPSDHQVTHVLLDDGHLWGKKRVAIPFSAVTSIDDGVRLNLAKDEVRDLPAIDVRDRA
jgi:sporulation protein YlmC with PRC-barrel domain